MSFQREKEVIRKTLTLQGNFFSLLSTSNECLAQAAKF